MDEQSAGLSGDTSQQVRCAACGLHHARRSAGACPRCQTAYGQGSSSAVGVSRAVRTAKSSRKKKAVLGGLLVGCFTVVVSFGLRSIGVLSPMAGTTCVENTSPGVVEGAGVRIRLEELRCHVRQLPPRLRDQLSLKNRYGMESYARMLATRKMLSLAAREGADLSKSRDDVVRWLRAAGQNDRDSIRQLLQGLGGSELLVDENQSLLAQSSVDDPARPTDPRPRWGRPVEDLTIASKSGNLRVLTDGDASAFVATYGYGETPLVADDLLYFELFSSGTMENISLSLNHLLPSVEVVSVPALAPAYMNAATERTRTRPFSWSFSSDVIFGGAAFDRSLSAAAPLYSRCILLGHDRQRAFAADARIQFRVGVLGDVSDVVVKDADSELCTDKPSECTALLCIARSLKGWRTRWDQGREATINATVHLDHAAALVDPNWQ